MRRYDIDSLRVIAFALLIFYHVGMFFVPWSFHIKNNVVYEGMVFPMLFLNQWRLSLLFIISGMGSWFALSKRSGLQFAGERVKRLFTPFLVGMVFIVPPQVYIERLDKGQFHGSYFDYWPSQAFQGTYPEGNISWHHLWFILYLLIFSLILIPAFLYMRKHTDAWGLRPLKAIVSRPFGLYILIIPLFLWQIFLAPHYPQTNGLINDWYNLINYGTLFFFGFLLISLRDTFWQTVSGNRRKYLICGFVAFPLLICIWYVLPGFHGRQYVSALVKVFNMWSWILALIGYAAVYLNKPGRALVYCNEAVYPFYILHQTVILLLAYYMKPMDMGFFPKFLLMVTGTFGCCWLLYEFGIRRYSLIRPLFGMKKKDNLQAPNKDR